MTDGTGLLRRTFKQFIIQLTEHNHLKANTKSGEFNDRLEAKDLY